MMVKFLRLYIENGSVAVDVPVCYDKTSGGQCKKRKKGWLLDAIRRSDPNV